MKSFHNASEHEYVATNSKSKLRSHWIHRMITLLAHMYIETGEPRKGKKRWPRIMDGEQILECLDGICGRGYEQVMTAALAEPKRTRQYCSIPTPK